jgi:hypothetical protein
MTRPRRDARPYRRSGENIVAKAMPFLASLTPEESPKALGRRDGGKALRGWSSRQVELGRGSLATPSAFLVGAAP